ncbi:hypothetical protein [[Phormidium] sp. LEGE 05292]|nr:hypothetical protein [Phormidium sp. LEGE 05292]
MTNSDSDRTYHLIKMRSRSVLSCISPFLLYTNRLFILFYS